MEPETPAHPEEAPQVTTLGRALALGVLALSLLLAPLAIGAAVQLSELSVVGLWYRFQQGGWGMWMILPALPGGVTLLLIFGILQLFRPRVALWPLCLVPSLACVAGLVFERRAAQLAAEVVLTHGIYAGQRLRIFAEGAGEALATHLFGSLTAGMLLLLAASVLAGRALLSAERLAWSSAAARALGGGAGLTLACLAYALVGQPPSPAAVVIAAFGAGYATLLCTLFGLTLQPETRDPSSARVSLWLSAAAIVAGLLCFASLSEAFAQSQLFAAIGGEAVPDELAAARAREALQLSGWAKLTLPSLALLPAVIAALTVSPAALKAAPQTRLTRDRWLLTWLLALGVGVVGLGRYATAASLERCVQFASPIVPAQFELAVALGGKPERFGASNPQAWIGKDKLVVTHDDAPEVNAPTSQLLDSACALRLGSARGYLRLPSVFVDTSLTARHLECLLPALLQLKPERDGVWDNGSADSLPLPTWGLLWRADTQLPQPYEGLIRRVVWLKMGIAAQRANVHLELQEAYWDLQRGEKRLRLEGALDRRVALLKGALEGHAAYVSIASAPHVPASFVLNAALAVSGAKCEPQLWVRGYSVLERPAPVEVVSHGIGLVGGSHLHFSSAGAEARRISDPEGALPGPVIERIVRGASKPLDACHNSVLAPWGSHTGQLSSRIVIEHGRVTESAWSGDIDDRALATCVDRAFKTLRFPDASKPTEVEYQVRFGAQPQP